MKKSFVRGTWQVKRAFSPAVITEGAGRTIFIGPCSEAPATGFACHSHRGDRGCNSICRP